MRNINEKKKKSNKNVVLMQRAGGRVLFAPPPPVLVMCGVIIYVVFQYKNGYRNIWHAIYFQLAGSLQIKKNSLFFIILLARRSRLLQVFFVVDCAKTFAINLGRMSIAKLAAIICEMFASQVQIAKGYAPNANKCICMYIERKL